MEDEDAPDLYIAGIRIDEDDVLDTLRQEGDEEVEKYLNGRMSKAVAYQRAYHRLRQMISMVTGGGDVRRFVLAASHFRRIRSEKDF